MGIENLITFNVSSLWKLSTNSLWYGYNEFENECRSKEIRPQSSYIENVYKLLTYLYKE